MKTEIWIAQDGLNCRMTLDMNRSFVAKIIKLMLRCEFWVKEKKEIIIAPFILPVIYKFQPLKGVAIDKKRRKEIKEETIKH